MVGFPLAMALSEMALVHGGETSPCINDAREEHIDDNKRFGKALAKILIYSLGDALRLYACETGSSLARRFVHSSLA